jgi:hypothetical protein
MAKFGEQARSLRQITPRRSSITTCGPEPVFDYRKQALEFANTIANWWSSSDKPPKWARSRLCYMRYDALSAILNHHVAGEAQWEQGFVHGGSK